MKQLVGAIAAALLIISCETVGVPIPSPIPTETVVPSRMPTKTATTGPTQTSPTATAFVLATPSGKPVSDWEGIPIMPGAVAGEAKPGGYTFTIRAAPVEILGFYDEAMREQGWIVLATGEGASGPVMQIYTRDSATASVLITPAGDGLSQVMIVQ